MRVVLDLSAAGSAEELHRRIAEALSFPAWYGGNLDALHDCLTELAAPVELVFCHKAALDGLLGRRADAFRRVTEDSAAENPLLTVRWEDDFTDGSN